MRGFRNTALGEVFYGMTPAIRWLVVSCLGIWLLELIGLAVLGPERLEQVLSYLGLWRPWPYAWQLVTYQFLHDPSGIAHVAFNMFALWMFGRHLDRRWGWRSFIAYYLTCGVGAGLFHVAMASVLPQHQGLVMGASGAVLGVLVAFGMTFPEQTVLLFFVIPMKAKHVVLLFAALELLLAWNPQGGVANLAHLGGMLTGWLYLRYLPRWRGLFSWSRIRGRVEGWRRARRRSRLEVVPDREWDEWLRRELDDETRH